MSDILHRCMVYMQSKSTDTEHVVVFVCGRVRVFCFHSPLGPSKPSWTFVEKVTANSLSRSTNFNLFVIFLDAFIMVVYDVKRSKFIMLTKKQKRRMVEADESSKVFLDRLWKCLVVIFFLGLFSRISCFVYAARYIGSSNSFTWSFGYACNFVLFNQC